MRRHVNFVRRTTVFVWCVAVLLAVSGRTAEKTQAQPQLSYDELIVALAKVKQSRAPFGCSVK